MFRGKSCTKMVKQHKGAIYSISIVGNSVITAGKDKKLKIFPDGDVTNKSAEAIKIPHIGRAIDQDENGNILVGCRNGVVYEIDSGRNRTELMWGHSDGEVWGLSIHPQHQNIILTTADDNRICVWDTDKRKRISKGKINKKRGKKKRIGGASTLSRYPPNQCSRACAFHPTNGQIAIG